MNMEAHLKNHWNSPEFDRLIEHAIATDDKTEQLLRLKLAYLFAARNAPPGTITAGILRMERPQEGNEFKCGPVNIEGLRRALVKEGLLDDDSSE